MGRRWHYVSEVVVDRRREPAAGKFGKPTLDGTGLKSLITDGDHSTITLRFLSDGKADRIYI